MSNFIACCGLDCEKCDARIATLTNDNSLREKTAKLWSKLNQAEITPEMINCTGCRVEGAKTPFCESFCEIRKCVQKNHLDTCGNCQEIDSCEKIALIIKNNPDVLNNLR